MVSGRNRCILPAPLAGFFSTLMTKPKSKQKKVAQAPAKADPSTDSDKTAKVSEHIGRELRSMFDDVVAEPVPDRFRELLEALEKKQAKD
jgi:hypothetical protein